MNYFAVSNEFSKFLQLYIYFEGSFTYFASTVYVYKSVEIYVGL